MTDKKKKAADPKASWAPGWVEADAAAAPRVIAEAGERAPLLVDAWVLAKNAAAVQAIANDERGPAPARKAARRGLGVLKSRGVPIPERSHIARAVGAETSVEEAWLLAPDGSGTSVITLATRSPTGRYRLVEVALRQGVGILQAHGGDLSRTQLRAAFDGTAERLGYEPAPVPAAWARARVAAARAENAKTGAILPLGLDSHKDLLEPVPSGTPPHPIDAEGLASDSDAAAAAARSATLHVEPEFRSWIPDGGAIQELIMKLGEAIGSAGADDKDKVDEAIRDEIAAATDRFFSPEIRAVVADRMKDAAVSVLARAGRERAADVVATASAIVAAGLITSPPRDIPFLRGFFQKALAILAARSGGQLPIPVAGPPPGGAIVDPAEAMAEAAAEKARPGERVTPGGIILP